MGKNWLQNVIYAGHSEECSADVRKQILISSLFSLISSVLLTIYGIDGLRTGKTLLAAIVLIFAAVDFINYFFLRRTGNYQISSMVIVVLMMILCVYLLCSGGNNNTGPLWFFLLPTLIFYILGLRRGLIIVSSLFTLMMYILYVPDNFLLQVVYSSVFTHRFAGAMFSVSVLAFVYEYTREESRKELLNLSCKLDQLSRKDELTGLSNRRDILEQLRNELNRFERSGHSFSVLIADIDHFKVINDTYGHECGDYVLQQIAVTFAQNTQKRDVVARWGGEEYLIFLPETDGKKAAKTAERLRQAIEDLSLTYETTTLAVTTSIGIAEYYTGQTVSQLINEADTFLYQAKNMGRNMIQGPAPEKNMIEVVSQRVADP